MHIPARAVPVLVAFAAMQSAQAQSTSFWTNPLGGSFQEPSNWSAGVPVGSGQGAQYDLNAAYTVGFTASAMINASHHRAGSVTFDLGGNTLTLLGTGATNPALRVGVLPLDNASLTILNGTVSAIHIGIADNGNTIPNPPKGAVTVSGPTARLLGQGDLGVGNTGVGTLTVSNGATVQGKGVVFGWIPTATGVGLVTGAGSTLQARDVYMGQEGKGRLLIDQGGRFSTTRVVRIGHTTSANGQVAIRGTGSRWTHAPEPANSEFTIGAQGPGALAVLEGGRVEATELVRVAPAGTLVGNSTVEAPVQNEGRVAPGGSYNDLLQEIVTTGIGDLSIVGPYTQLAAGSLPLELGGAGNGQFDRLLVSGAASLGGRLSLSLVSGFQPSLNQEFQLLTASLRTGTFANLDFPTLPGGLSFAVEYGLTDVRVRVVPAPGTAFAALAVCAAPLTRRRRTR